MITDLITATIDALGLRESLMPYVTQLALGTKVVLLAGAVVLLVKVLRRKKRRASVLDFDRTDVPDHLLRR